MAIRHDEQMIVNGRLTQVGLSFRANVYGARASVVECSCGTRTIVFIGNLKSTTLSCGCLQKEQVAKRSKTHGHAVRKNNSPEYRTWVAMRTRCYNTKSDSYKDYGGRGITVCERWETFVNFIDDMGERPSGLEIDRIDNNRGYSPENCRWATKSENGRNKRSNRMITSNGKTLCCAEWAEIIGIPCESLRQRLNHGWSIEDCLDTPMNARRALKKAKK